VNALEWGKLAATLFSDRRKKKKIKSGSKGLDTLAHALNGYGKGK
jgi:hypothetical protein